jgi:hypothetical protein
MVTKPDNAVPPGPTGLEKAPTKIEPMTPASGFAGTNLPKGPGPLYRDGEGPSSFKLPEKVTPAEIKEQSYRYGGGRSAGNRSLAANKARQKDQP